MDWTYCLRRWCCWTCWTRTRWLFRPLEALLRWRQSATTQKSRCEWMSPSWISLCRRKHSPREMSYVSTVRTNAPEEESRRHWWPLANFLCSLRTKRNVTFKMISSKAVWVTANLSIFVHIAYEQLSRLTSRQMPRLHIPRMPVYLRGQQRRLTSFLCMHRLVM